MDYQNENDSTNLVSPSANRILSLAGETSVSLKDSINVKVALNVSIADKGESDITY